jgi:hypothetical protein
MSQDGNKIENLGVVNGEEGVRAAVDFRLAHENNPVQKLSIDVAADTFLTIDRRLRDLLRKTPGAYEKAEDGREMLTSVGMDIVTEFFEHALPCMMSTIFVNLVSNYVEADMVGRIAPLLGENCCKSILLSGVALAKGEHLTAPTANS